jgi:hypothetical protein
VPGRRQAPTLDPPLGIATFPENLKQGERGNSTHFLQAQKMWKQYLRAMAHDPGKRGPPGAGSYGGDGGMFRLYSPTT